MLKYIILQNQEISQDLLDSINVGESTFPTKIWLVEPDIDNNISGVESQYSYITTEEAFPKNFSGYKKLTEEQFLEAKSLIKTSDLFENKTLQNVNIADKDLDTGAILFSPKFAPTGWHQKIHEFEFTTAKLNSLEDEKDDLTPYNYGTMTFLDASKNVLTTQQDIDASCVLTYVDWTTPHDLMVLSGFAKQIVKPSSRCKIWGIVSPYLTSEQGKSVFVDGTNLEFEEPGNSVGIQGVAGTIIPHVEIIPNSGLYSNMIRLQVWTPDSPGLKHRIQIKLDLFVPQGV